MPRLVKDASKAVHCRLRGLYADKCVADYLSEMYMKTGKTPPTAAFERYEYALYTLTAVFGVAAVLQMEKAIAEEVEPYQENYKKIAKHLFDQRQEATECHV